MGKAKLLLMVASVLLLVLALLVSALSRHKKYAARRVNVIGAFGVIETNLEPEGAVIVHGELWRARSKDGANMDSRTRIRVVGVQAHLLLVESASQKHSRERTS